ncbi:LacI family DNA-binding transcriptional regulator [Gymnodinialimonas hymeniacidonis]|uniref:LacI family DNA-binding transcriptional regulator n=1 Tax=Gymnodinialimonas hymeniacidonis TaxID=3126508 RepID=UPI0034C6D307
MRATLKDLARAANVSTATADRALNNRAGVSARTRAIVLQAAHRIGYVAETPASPRPVHLAILLPRGTNAFIEELRHHLRRMASHDGTLTLDFPDIADPTPDAMRTAIEQVAGADGIAVLARHHPLVQDAVQRVTRAGTPVVTLASDLPGSGRLAYIGVDDMRAGRLAGQVITRFLGPRPAGKIALFAGSLSYRAHQEREMGLRQLLSEDAPGLSLLEIRESDENRNQAQAQMAELLSNHDDLVAIYNAGGGTQGIARALKAAERDRGLVFVAHDLTEPNKGLLLDGTLDTVIDQSARAEAAEVLATLTAAARGQDHSFTPPQSNLILRENLPL